MQNLLAETKESIKYTGHTSDDIIFIGSEKSGYSCTWDEFCVLADKEYDNGYGSSEVATDLIIVFSDGQKMWRGEYDGAEWWECSSPFVKPKALKPIKSLFTNSIGWDELEEIHK